MIQNDNTGRSLHKSQSVPDLTQMHQPDEVKLNTHKVRLEENAKAYNKEFHSGGCLGFCRATGRCLLDYLIYPIVLAAVFVLACTILLPLSIYYTVTATRDHLSNIDHKDIKDLLNIDCTGSNIYSIEQIRIRAKKEREQEKSTTRKGCDICLSLLCPCTGVFILYNKVKNYFYQIEPSHKLKTYYSQPPSAAELKWLQNRQCPISTLPSAAGAVPSGGNAMVTASS